MNEKIDKLVTTKLEKIFNDYPDNLDLKELKDELTSDLIASAEDKMTPEIDESEAVTQAFQEFGDIDDVINQVLNESKDYDTNHYHKTIQAHNIDLDDQGVRIDNGKVLNINDQGITINNGKTMRISADGIKLGNMVINEDGINFHDRTEASDNRSFDEFNAKFNQNDFETEVHVESLPLVDTKDFETQSLTKIDVSYENADLKILPTDGDKIIVREYMSRNNPDYQVKTQVKDDTLTIVQGRVPHFLPLRIKVQVLLPISFNGFLRVSSNSGSLLIQNLSSLQETLINVHSGLINVRDVVVEKMLIKAASGKVVLEDLNAKEELSVDSKSSVINLDNVYSAKYELMAKSGTIKAVDLGGGGLITAKSGTIKVDFEKVTSDVNVNNASGTIKLTMPKDDSFAFDLEAHSGIVRFNKDATYQHDIQNLKEGIVGDAPQYKLVARATSGTIKVN